MKIQRAIIAVCFAPLLAVGCSSGGNFTGYGDVDRSALRGGPPNAQNGACYAEVVYPPVVRRASSGGGARPGYRKVTKIVTERVGGSGGGPERTVWVSPNNVPPNARVLAQRARDGMLLVVVGGGKGGKGRLVKRKVTQYVPVRGGTAKTTEKRVGPARAAWAQVLCDNPSSSPKIKAAQQRLARLGFYEGPIDGRYGRNFNRALTAYQAKNRLAVGGLTRQTARRLGVRF